MEPKIYIVTSTGVSRKTDTPKPFSIASRITEKNGNTNINEKDTIYLPEQLPMFTKIQVNYQVLK